MNDQTNSDRLLGPARRKPAGPNKLMMAIGLGLTLRGFIVSRYLSMRACDQPCRSSSTGRIRSRICWQSGSGCGTTP